MDYRMIALRGVIQQARSEKANLPIREALEEMLADYKDAALDFDAYNQEAAEEIIKRAEDVIGRSLGND